MERVYFSINEAGAKTANDMMSFSEYKTGSKTAGYKAQVDKAYELAEKVIEARPTEEERVSKLCERYSRRLAQNINKDIQMGELWSGCKYPDEVLDWMKSNYEIESCI